MTKMSIVFEIFILAKKQQQKKFTFCVTKCHKSLVLADMLRNVVLVSSLSILISLTLFQCYRSSYVYLQDPTFFSSTFEDQRWADLPDITACLDPREGNWPAFKSTELSNQNWKKLFLDGKQHNFDNVTFSNDWDIVEYWYIRRFETG